TGRTFSELRLIRRSLLTVAGLGRVGIWGESVSVRYLSKQGFSILLRNWRRSRFEADIIAAQDRTLVFIEVKTRHISQQRNFPAQAAVTAEKMKNLNYLLDLFMRTKSPLCRRLGIKHARIDTIEVYYEKSYRFKRTRSVIHHLGVRVAVNPKTTCIR